MDPELISPKYADTSHRFQIYGNAEPRCGLPGYAFLIGIKDYLEGIPTLHTPVNDATKIGQVLADSLGFQVHRLDNPTKREVEDFLTYMQQLNIPEESRVLVFYAGHGKYGFENNVVKGSIQLADSQPGKPDSWIKMDDMVRTLLGLRSKHLLLVLDCCNAGAVDTGGKTRFMGAYKEEGKLSVQDVKNYSTLASRQVMTSANLNQFASDGKGNSPFAIAFAEAISGKADGFMDKSGSTKDQVVTADEANKYVKAELAKENQAPNLSELDGHKAGEFFFFLPDFNLSSLPDSLKKYESIQDFNPYKGLNSYEEADAPVFFGRENEINEVYRHIREQPLTVVVGDSGTGKSSLVKAGVFPKLRKDGLSVESMRPGDFPVEAFKAVGNPDVILVDQFEELVTIGRKDRDKVESEFLGALLDRIEQGRKVVVTIRSGFELQVKEKFEVLHRKRSPNGVSFWGTGRCDEIGDLRREAYEEIIYRPAKGSGTYFQPPELISEIAKEADKHKGILPMLSLSLYELFKQRVAENGRYVITRKHYEKGQLRASVTKAADKLLINLTNFKPEYGEAIRKIMLKMVVERDEELAKRRATINELNFPDILPDHVECVIKDLVNNKLLTESRENGKRSFEPVHDALVKEWKSLLDWRIALGKDALSLMEALRLDLEAYQNDKEQGKNVSALITAPDFPVVRFIFEKYQNRFISIAPKQKLWTGNHRLKHAILLRDNKKLSWMNRDEHDFVTKSQHRRKIQDNWLTGLSLAAVLIVSLFGIKARISAGEARQKTFDSVLTYSKSLKQEGNYTEALEQLDSSLVSLNEKEKSEKAETIKTLKGKWAQIKVLVDSVEKLSIADALTKQTLLDKAIAIEKDTLLRNKRFRIIAQRDSIYKVDTEKAKAIFAFDGCRFAHEYCIRASKAMPEKMEEIRAILKNCPHHIELASPDASHFSNNLNQ